MLRKDGEIELTVGEAVSAGLAVPFGGERIFELGEPGDVPAGAGHTLDEARTYARDRKQFGKPIGEFQLIQAMLADSQAELLAGWSLVQDVAQRYDAKGGPGVADADVAMRASCAKMFCTEMVGRVADRGVQVHGGAGYINEYPVERFYRDVRLLRLYEGTTQIQQVIIGRQMLRAAA